MLFGKSRRRKRAEEVLFGNANEAKKFVWYRVRGIPYETLSEEQVEAYMNAFAAMVASSEEGMVYGRRKKITVKVESHSFDRIIPEYFVKLSRPVYTIFDVQSVEDPFESRAKVIDYNIPSFLVLSDGTYAKVLVACRFPTGRLEVLMYYGLCTGADEVIFVWRKVQQGTAQAMINKVLSRKKQSDRVEDADYVSKLRELHQRLSVGADAIAFHLMFVVKGESPSILREKIVKLKDNMKGCGVELDEPPVFQDELYEGRTTFLNGVVGLETYYTDTESVKAFFPFVGDGLYDPNGVFVGFTSSGHVVQFDIYARYNYNLVVLGSTGSGKSVFTKVFLRRMYSKGYGVMGIDPENEYVKVANYFGATPVIVSDKKKVGLDPVKLYAMGYLDLNQVVDILTEAYHVKDEYKGVLGTCLNEYCQKHKEDPNIFDFVQSLPHYLKKPLQLATIPPHSNLYEGTPPRVEGNVIFGLKDVRSRALKVLVSALLAPYYLNKLYGQEISGCVFFVDEGWLFTEYVHTLKLFEDLARRGRKRKIAFVFTTQRAEELAKKKEGRAILEQAASALLLKHTRAGIDELKKIYKLTDREASFLVNANVGQGIFKVEDVRYVIQVMPTDKELRMFST